MKKLFFTLSFAFLAIFMVGCKQSGGTADAGAIKESYQNKMDSLKVSLMRSYNAKFDSMRNGYEDRIKELEIQVANVSSPNKGAAKSGLNAPGGKPGSKGNAASGSASGSGSAPQNTNGKTSVTQRGQNAINNAKDQINDAANQVKKKTSVTNRGGN